MSRGLARNEAEYKRRLMAADEPSHGGADGRGALSEQQLAEFARFFLETCLDQVRFMEGLMRPDQLRGCIEAWATQETAQGRLPAGAWPVLREALYTGEFPRAALPGLLGVGERQARNVSAALVRAGALNAQSSPVAADILRQTGRGCFRRRDRAAAGPVTSGGHRADTDPIHGTGPAVDRVRFFLNSPSIREYRAIV